MSETATATEAVVETGTTDGTTTGTEPKVILFNDNIHTFEEVITQCMKAIGCSRARGEEIANSVHTKGKEVVYSGDMDKCLKVSAILEEIELHTQIEV